jgi:gluconolactonase
VSYLLFPPPRIIESSVFTAMPDELRRPVVTEWSRANKRGQPVDSYLEGPCVDRRGHLLVTDIPHGRIFRVTPGGAWHLVVEYDGEPNGLALHPDGRVFVADYKNGILALDPDTGAITPVLLRRNSQRFKGVNDLTFASNSDLYFTDQGQTGLHDPTGCVYRYGRDGRLDCLIDNGPSPNGLTLSPEEDVLFVAMTRDNAVWRVPLLPEGGTGKVCRFASFHGPTGPDGMATDLAGNVLVAHAAWGAVVVHGPQGQVVAAIRSCRGQFLTNLVFGGEGGREIYITDSSTGSILRAEWEIGGAIR